jgi:hypothetical protein
MIRTALGLVGMAGMILAASCSAHASDAIRFEVHSPSTVTVESLPSGGFRITVEPLGDGEPPIPPKPNPDVDDMISTALSQLPPSERSATARVFAEAAEALAGLSHATPDLAGHALLVTASARIGPTFVREHGDALAMLAFALLEMPGISLTSKWQAYRDRMKREAGL